MSNSYNFVIQGTGFRSIFAAMYLANKGKKVCLIDRGGEIYSFLKPFVWNGYILDKGPQYFDDFRMSDWELLNELLDGDYFQDIGFSYGSFANGNLSTDFAIPVWNHFSDLNLDDVFDDLIISRKENYDKFEHFDEYLKFDGGSKLYQHLRMFTEKFLIKDSSELSAVTKNIIPFCGRKVLFDNKKSMQLKQDQFYDNVLAAKKKDVDSDRYNLYPKSTNNEDIRLALEKALKRLNVDLYLQCEIEELSHKKNEMKLNDGSKFKFEKVFLADNIQNTENYFFKTEKISNNIFKLPKIFFIFKIKKNSFLNRNYIVNYDLNHISTRITNFSNYSNLERENDVICVEAPTLLNSNMWKTPEKFVEKIKNEINEVAGKNVEVLDFKCFNIPTTYKLPLKQYDDSVDEFVNKIYEEKNYVLPNHLFLTRKNSIDTVKQVIDF